MWRKVLVASVVSAVVGVGGLSHAATTTTEIYPGNFEGWGVPGPPPDGNFGGVISGTISFPTFVTHDGREALSIGNDGGLGDFMLITTPTASPSSGPLYDGARLDTFTQITISNWKSSQNPVTLVDPDPATYAVTGGLVFGIEYPNLRPGVEYQHRLKTDWINFATIEEVGGYTGSPNLNAARAAYPFNQWADWVVDTDLKAFEAGNIVGAGNEFWPNETTTDGFGVPQGVLLSIDDILSVDPDAKLRIRSNGSAVYATMNHHGNRSEVYLDKVSFTFAGSPLDGDANLDGTVNGLDLSIVAANWQTAVGGGSADGDFNDDGTVNGLDLSTLAANWLQTGGDNTEVWDFRTGASGASGGGVSFEEALAQTGLGGIPEPSSLMLLAGGAMLLVRRRRA